MTTMKMILRALNVTLLLPTAIAAAANPPSSLGIGDPPPPLEPMAWIKDGPMPALRADRVHVVYFFATWCGASRQAMTQMSRLARKYGDDLEVVGINVRESERGEATVEAVSRFVVERGADMDHRVAMDDPEKTPLFESWMRAAGMYGTPTAFIIGRDGRITYIGIPIDDTVEYPFEQALADAIVGTSDLEAARSVHADTEREISEYLEVRALMAPVEAAREQGDDAGVIRAIDDIVARHPEHRLRVLSMKLSALLRQDEEAAFAFIDRELAFVDSRAELRANRAGIMGSIGSTIASEPALSPAAYDRALDLLRQSLEIEPNGYGALINWMSVARLEHARDNLEAAITAQEQVVALAEKAPEVPREALPDLQATLAEYRAELAARATETGP